MFYIKNPADNKIPQIEDGLKQTFNHKFSSTISKQVIINMKEEGKLSDRDLEIARFLFRFRFATVEQVYEYLKIIGFINKTELPNGEVKETTILSIKSRLNKLVSYRVLNKFKLGIAQDAQIEEDAFQVYCLDWGGKYLLANYSNEDTSNWYTSENLKASCHIGKDLTVTNIYLKLLAHFGKSLVAFEKTPLRRADNLNLVPTFDFTINHMGEYKHFICEDIKCFDLPIEFRKKVLKLEKLLTTNYWKKYYFCSPTPPILLLFGESDREALESARIIAGQTSITDFRINTEDRFMEDMSVFFKYVEDKDYLQKVRISLFA